MKDDVLINKFFGEVTYKLDSKMRVVNPAYDENAQDSTVYLLISAKQHNYDRCVLCMNIEQFKAHYEKLVNVPKGTPAYELVKHILSSVVKLKPDKQGKMLVPKHLRDYAGIDGDAVTFRVTDECMEMWSAERLDKKREHDLTNAAAYRDFNRYMNGGCSDYSDDEKYSAECESLKREIDVLELTTRRDELRGQREDG